MFHQSPAARCRNQKIVLSLIPFGIGLAFLLSLLKAANEALAREQFVLIGRALTEPPASAIESCLYTM